MRVAFGVINRYNRCNRYAVISFIETACNFAGRAVTQCKRSGYNVYAVNINRVENVLIYRICAVVDSFNAAIGIKYFNRVTCIVGYTLRVVVCFILVSYDNFCNSGV